MKHSVAHLLLTFVVGVIMIFVTLTTSNKLLLASSTITAGTIDSSFLQQQSYNQQSYNQQSKKNDHITTSTQQQQQQKQQQQQDDSVYFATIDEWPIPLPHPAATIATIAEEEDEQQNQTTTTTTTTKHRNNHNNNNNQIHWCIIGRHSSSKSARRFFWHFPHAAESLLPCWSWWRRWNAVDQCGLILFDALLLPIGSWHHQLIVEELNCTIYHFGPHEKGLNRTHPFQSQNYKKNHDNNDNNDNNNDNNDNNNDNNHPIYYTPSLYWKNPRYGRLNYLELAEDAWALRRRFISDQEIVRRKTLTNANAATTSTSTTSTSTSTTTTSIPPLLHIGILQRHPATRYITNLNDIVTLLRQSIPDATITILSNDNTNTNNTNTNTNNSMPSRLSDQAAWFATKDIIIGAHGAAMMNCLFILPKTIVLQLYPPNYFFQSLEPLIETVGGIALDWYEGAEPLVDWRRARLVTNTNNIARNGNITPPPHQVVDPLLFTMGRKVTPSGWDNDVGVTGTNWSKSLSWMA